VVPLAWMFSRESVLFSPWLVPARGLKLVPNKATSKASFAVLLLSPSTKWLSLMVNCRRLAPAGMMRSWVSWASFWLVSVRVAAPLLIVVPPCRFQPAVLVKSPFSIANSAPAVSAALGFWWIGF
jgi:hypothetical protein